MYVLIDITVLWPTVMRLYYLQRVSTIIKSFYSDTNEWLAQLKHRKSLTAIFIVILVILLYQLVFFSLVSTIT